METSPFKQWCTVLFRKILVANRGEIALRVMRTCREMGIKTVAIYSSADTGALHVKYADEAYPIGPPKPEESYLNIRKVIDVCRSAGVDAVHPGYGFLAENHLFVEKCLEEGVVFIGPSPKPMKNLGDKIHARRLAKKLGVPVIPGTTQPVEAVEEAAGKAEEIGYPILLKASGGGGGRGMRFIEKEKDLFSSFEAAREEALKSFGDPTLYIEKAFINPRHIEVQVLGDKHGNVIHLFERECSIQRRYQKLVEESPSSVVDEESRKEICRYAVKIAKAAKYDNAGTIEFLRDKEGKYYFLEVNTRIQVEHPVTEMVTGVDLVKEQIRVASGEEICFKQREIEINGHSIECRVYAEDPANNFAPSPGKILSYQTPCGPNVRVESSVYQGYEIPLFYDALISKLIVWGHDRSESIVRLRDALKEYILTGVKTNLSLLRNIANDPDFINGNIDTGYLKRKLNELNKPGREYLPVIAAALVKAMKGKGREPEKLIFQEGGKQVNLWQLLGRRELHSSSQTWWMNRWGRNTRYQLTE